MSVTYDAPREDPSRVKELARLLRGVGAAVLLAAASTFLIQQWHDAGDIPRYLGLLGLTAMLAGAGFLVGIGMRESRSARTFLALAAATVPAHFAIVGGFLYSVWAPPGSGLPTASYALWHAPNAPSALLVAGLSLIVMAPVVQLAFTALARARASAATLLLFGTGLAMWIPSRDPYFATALIALSAFALAAFEFRWLRRARGLRTWEGVLLRLILLAPATLLAARTLLHYEFSWFTMTALGASATLLGATLSVEARVPQAWRRVAEATALFAGLATCASFAFGVDEVFALPPSMLFVMQGVPFALALGTTAYLIPARRTSYANAASGVALATVLLDLLLFGDVAMGLVALVVGVVALADGFLRERRTLCVVGALTAAWALVLQVLQAAAHYSWSGWGALAVIGAWVILIAALLERHHETMRTRALAFRERVANFEY